ncbi:Suppressor of Essential Function, partial [Scheffersomyces stipitis CBS 6054]
MAVEGKVKHRRSKRACTGCRQIKLKCDAIERFPKKCTRCQRLGHICEIDSGFKREPARAARVFKPHDHKDFLNVMIGSSDDSPARNFQEVNTGNVSLMTSKAHSNHPPISSNNRELFPALLTLRQNVIDPDIPYDKVRLMFETFFLNNWLHLPISKSLLDPIFLWEKNYKLLFYAICHAACPACCPEFEPFLEMKLRELLSTSDSTFMIDPFHSLSTIFGLLVICYWPLRTASLQSDDSLMYISRATNLAMKIGLHQLSYSREYCISADDSLRQQMEAASIAWAGCFISSTLFNSFVGIPNSLPLLVNSLNKIDGNEYLAEFKVQLKVCHVIQVALNTLGCNSDTDYGMVDPIIRGTQHKAIIDNLSLVQSEFSHCSEVSELICLHAKLLIHSFLLAPDTLEKDRKSAVTSLYLVCVKSIETLVELHDSDQEGTIALPIFVVVTTTMSAIILFGLSICSYESLIDKDMARNSLSNFFRIMQNLARRPDDSATRAMRLLNGLQTLHTKKLINEPIFTVRTRMGASGFWSLLLTFKRAQLAERRETANIQEASSQDMRTKSLDDDVSVTSIDQVMQVSSSDGSSTANMIDTFFGNMFDLLWDD